METQGRKKKRRLRGVRVLVFVGVLGIIYLATLAVRVYLDGLRDERARADVIIVLGAAQYDGRPSKVYRARLDHALGLYDAGYAPAMMFTGGRKQGDRFTEANAGRLYARRHGVPEAAILLESQGRTTHQSLQSAAEIMRRRHLRTAVLVSDPFHAFRLRHMARNLGMHVFVSPARHSAIRSPRAQAYFIAREVGVYAVYRLFGM